MMEKPLSKRANLAQHLASLVTQLHLTSPYGGEAHQQDKYYSIGFSKAAILDGEIRLYSEKFIQISWQTAIRDLPLKDSLVFETIEHAEKFIELAFVSYDYQQAFAIPVKNKKTKH
jgi:hypothetical protein